MLQNSAHDRVRLLQEMPELELWTACHASCEAVVSRDCAVLVCGDDVPGWDLPTEGCGKFLHSSEEVNLGSHGFCNVELLFRVTHYFVGFRQVEVLDADVLRLKYV